MNDNNISSVVLYLLPITPIYCIAYYGKGWRYYLIGKMPISRNLDAWIRLAQTNVSDRATIGSGTSEIDGNRKTDLKVQLKYSF